MEIPTDLRERLVKEIKFVAEKIRTEKDPRTKVYYFSGIYGEMLRLVNIHFDKELLFAHNVLNYVYQTMKTRVDIVVMGRDSLVDFPDGFFDRLSEYLDRLASCIENNEELYRILQEFSCLAYITTGNGYYLFQKGILRI